MHFIVPAVFVLTVLLLLVQAGKAQRGKAWQVPYAAATCPSRAAGCLQCSPKARVLVWSPQPQRRWALLLLHCLLPSFITGRNAVSEPRHRDSQVRTESLYLRFKQQAISDAHSLVTKARAIRDTMVSRREVKSTGTHWFLREEQKQLFANYQ